MVTAAYIHHLCTGGDLDFLTVFWRRVMGSYGTWVGCDSYPPARSVSLQLLSLHQIFPAFSLISSLVFALCAHAVPQGFHPYARSFLSAWTSSKLVAPFSALSNSLA